MKINHYNFIYDIYLNLNEILYDFFDWNKNDKLIHIKKIPIIKVSEDTLKKIIYNKIKISDELLARLYNKTDIWNNKKINYLSLFTDSFNIIGIEFDEHGNSIRKSYLIIEEELEILEVVDKFNEEIIDFKLLSKEKELFKTRKELKDENFVINELKKSNDSKLKFLYLECFGKHENNKQVILDKINNINKESKTYKQLYNILKLTK